MPDCTRDYHILDINPQLGRDASAMPKAISLGTPDATNVLAIDVASHAIFCVGAERVPLCDHCASRSPSVMDDDVQQRRVNLQSAVIFDEAELAELVHEEIDS
jgi:hypothetical protein